MRGLSNARIAMHLSLAGKADTSFSYRIYIILTMNTVIYERDM